MNTATKNLENDHVYILKLIDLMEHITRSGITDINHLDSIVDIIRNFADGLHHSKEENLFFPLLAEKGFSTERGPVAVMLHEHMLGRNYVKGMAENISLFKKGNKAALDEIYRNMNGYAELLRSHISKENNILFPMADKVLSESDHNDLLMRFKEAEKNHVSRADSSEYIIRIQGMLTFYKI